MGSEMCIRDSVEREWCKEGNMRGPPQSIVVELMYGETRYNMVASLLGETYGMVGVP